MPRVIIIGAGLAGLCAAEKLQRAGLEVLVLEARDRVGGRTHSAQLGRGRFDLGGQWIGPLHTRLAALAQRLGVERFPTYTLGTKKLRLGEQVRSYEGDIPSANLLHLAELQLELWGLDRLRKSVPPQDPFSAPRGPLWDALSVEEWKRQHLRSSSARGLFDVAVRSVFSCEPAELSFLYLLAYANAGGGFDNLLQVRGANQDARFHGGAQQLSEGLARGLGDALHLGEPALRVEHTARGVRVQTAADTYAGDAVVVAVPPALVPRIDFDPALPSALHDLRSGMRTGTTLKCLLLFERPFWRDRGEAGEAYSDAGPVVFTYDNSTRDGAQPALVAFVVGRSARALSLQSPASRRDAIVDAVARLHGPEVRSYTHFVEHDWSQDRWSGGCPTGLCGTGSYGTHAANLRTPVGRIRWAGTESAVEHTGFMEGALESGERAASEVLAMPGLSPR